MGVKKERGIVKGIVQPVYIPTHAGQFHLNVAGLRIRAYPAFTANNMPKHSRVRGRKMIDHLITSEQVRTHRYGVWACDKKGQAHVYGLCAAEVCDVSYWPVSQQCTRFANAGPQLLYCKVHARGFVGAAP